MKNYWEPGWEGEIQGEPVVTVIASEIPDEAWEWHWRARGSPRSGWETETWWTVGENYAGSGWHRGDSLPEVLTLTGGACYDEPKQRTKLTCVIPKRFVALTRGDPTLGEVCP